MRTAFIFLAMVTMLADRSNTDIQIVWISVGGPDLNDPIIIRRVPHTYHYPDGAGRLELGEGTFYLDAPMPV